MKIFNKTSDEKIFKVDRRTFLKVGSVSATGLVLGVQWSCSEPVKLTGNPEAIFSPNVYLSIDGLGKVTIVAHRSEMGTGIRTSLPLIVADEMEADWDQVSLIQAEGDEKYGNQNTDGSFSIRMFYMPMRRAGAAARKMLEQAAANEWQVDISECTAKDHRVEHTSGKAFGFGYLAEKAAALDIPEADQLLLKSPKDFKYITKKTSIYDLEDIVTGKAGFGMDTQIEGAKVALIRRPPVAGGKVKSFDPAAALSIPGVQKVFELNSQSFPSGFQNPLGGIVVVADNTWSAMKGRDALTVTWDDGPNANYDSTKRTNELMTQSSGKGKVRREQGKVQEALSGASKVVGTQFKIPHFSHAPMETPCAVANYTGDAMEMWLPTQEPQWARGATSAAVGLDPANVRINVTMLGGGFGRKSKPDYAVEAALISKESGVPIKLLWTREDDIQHDFYHANSSQQLKVGIDEKNNVSGWLHRSAFPTIGGTADPAAVDPSTFEISQGLIDMPNDIANVCCETFPTPANIRIGWLRSVANINHGFAVGCTMDEVAEARKVDPAQNLLDLLGGDRNIDFNALSQEFWNYEEKLEDYPWSTSRFRNVIETVREKSDWGKTSPAGSGMGIAAHRSFLTYVACVVDVSVENKKVKINNVNYAVDCGVPVNPERIKSQFEGGAVFGTSLALKSQITVKKGRVEQSNFHDYQLARMPDAPFKTAVHIIDSEEKPTGVGEPPVPPFIPALCNAIYAATGQRIRELPIKLA